MALVNLVRRLLRFRLLVLFGLVPALLLGARLGFDVSTNPPGLASRAVKSVSVSTRVFLQDARASAVDLGPSVTDGLGTRARLMADLMATDVRRGDIARRAGIVPQDLTVITPASDVVPVLVPVAVKSATAANLISTPYALVLGADGNIPIVSLRASAPRPADARRVVVAAVQTLNQMIVDGTVRSRPPALNMAELGAPTATVTTQGSKLALALAATVMLFGMWWGAVLVGRAIVARGHPRVG
jgi:hypothetical protein